MIKISISKQRLVFFLFFLSALSYFLGVRFALLFVSESLIVVDFALDHQFWHFARGRLFPLLSHARRVSNYCYRLKRSHRYIDRLCNSRLDTIDLWGHIVVTSDDRKDNGWSRAGSSFSWPRLATGFQFARACTSRYLGELLCLGVSFDKGYEGLLKVALERDKLAIESTDHVWGVFCNSCRVVCCVCTLCGGCRCRVCTKL